MMGSEGPVVQADSTWFSEPHIVRGSTATVTDLTVPAVRAAVVRQVVYARAFRLRRFCGRGRLPEFEDVAGDPNAVHDHCELARDGDDRPLHAATLGDGNAPGPQP